MSLTCKPYLFVFQVKNSVVIADEGVSKNPCVYAIIRGNCEVALKILSNYILTGWHCVDVFTTQCNNNRIKHRFPLVVSAKTSVETD